MDRLFRIKVRHAGPKDSHTSIETYLVADSDLAVAHWIEREKRNSYWFTPYRWDDPYRRHDPETRIDISTGKEVSLLDYILANKGDLDDDIGYDDAYYGVTKWGWEEVLASPAEIETLRRLGIAEKPTP